MMQNREKKNNNKGNVNEWSLLWPTGAQSHWAHVETPQDCPLGD